MRISAAAPLLAILALQAHAWPGRSAQAVSEFRKANPCPATGKVRGACPGWQVDHITPLKCGGADRPENMQWLTANDHKAKTAREAKSCRRPR